MKFLLMTNERDEDDPILRQWGVRKAFDKLHSDGAITELVTYSYLSRLRVRGMEGFRAEALGVIAKLKPDILFVQRVDGSALRADFWRACIEVSPATTIVYHEADPYALTFKRIGPAMKDIIPIAHLSIVCGLGFLSKEFRRLGAQRVKYLPHCYDTVRFFRTEPFVNVTHDIVAIGNSGRSRKLPFLFVPGGRKRDALFRKLDAIYGERFALYGSGWEGISASKGRVPFPDQEAAIQRGRISVNWDHFDDIPFYFSDRLPISLAAGIPHVTSHHFGYEAVFRNCPGLYWGKTVAEVLDCVELLLSRSDDALKEEGLAARRWVAENLEANAVYRRAFEMSRDVHRERQVMAQ